MSRSVLRTELDIHFNKKAMQSQTLPRDATTKVNKHPAATPPPTDGRTFLPGLLGHLEDDLKMKRKQSNMYYCTCNMAGKYGFEVTK